ncbi:MAG: thiamine pyrophosphate-dependent enzyme [Candidatus Altiarchaeota archaeon]
MNQGLYQGFSVNGAELLMKSLKDQGVEYIFGIVGREAEALLFDEADIDFILTRDERTAAIAAEVYGRLTGRAGVCYSTFGPGATNLMTGIASAYLDRAPLVAVSAQVEADEVHPSTHQCVDQVGMAYPITKWSYEIERVSKIPDMVEKAFFIAETERPGPTYLSIPVDLLQKKSDLRNFQIKKYNKNRSLEKKPGKEVFEKLYELLKNSRLPIAVIGNGVVRAGVTTLLEFFIEKYQVGVVSTYGGKGGISSHHNLYLGTISKYLDDLLQYKIIDAIFSEADLILAIGFDVAEGNKPEIWEVGKEKTVVRIDSIPNDVGKLFTHEFEVVGDLGEILKWLSKKSYNSEKRHRLDEIQGKIQEKKDLLINRTEKTKIPLTPMKIVSTVRKVLGPRDILVSDVGIHKQFACLFYDAIHPKTFLCSNGLGCMGFGLPAAIGAKFACPERDVVAICGDGGFHSGSQDLETCARYKLPVVVIVMKDDSFGLIKHYQLAGQGKINSSSVDFGNVDFVKLAKANGCLGYHIQSVDHLKDTLTQALDSDQPTVLEVPVKYDYSFKGK